MVLSLQQMPSFLRKSVSYRLCIEGVITATLGHSHRTGYVNMREINKELFGSDVIEKTSEIWGLDDEGELRGSYRPSGYHGVRTCSLYHRFTSDIA